MAIRGSAVYKNRDPSYWIIFPLPFFHNECLFHNGCLSWPYLGRYKRDWKLGTYIDVNERKCILIIIPNILLELSLLNVFIKGFVSWLGEHVVLDYKFCLYRRAAFWGHTSLHAILLFVIYLFVYSWTTLNKEYTTHTVCYLLKCFRHLFTILICIFNNNMLIRFIRGSLRMLFYAEMTVDVISVHYMLIKYREKPTTFI